MRTKMNKEDWIALFREIGLSEDAMMKWHRLFESRHAEAHEDFLAWLGLSTEERAKIRAQSR